MAKDKINQWLDSVSGGGSAMGMGSESLSELWNPENETVPAVQANDLGHALIKANAIDAALLDRAMTIASQTPGKALADIFHDIGVDESAVQAAVASVNELDFKRFATIDVNVNRLEQLTHEFCKEQGVIPLKGTGSRLILGVTHPEKLFVIDEVRHKLGVGVKPVVVCQNDIAIVLESLHVEQDSSSAVDDIIAGVEEEDVEVVQSTEEEVDLEKVAGESPVIRLVNYLIFNAVKEGASDIHIEPQEKRLRIRYRIDGILFEMMNPPHHMQAAIVSRIKIMSNLDISERRLPQDGRIRAMVHGRKLDLRVSTLPTAAGEKVVMRILDTKSIQVTLDQLGMGEDALLIWKHQINQPHGIILVTGPTGSGKTTTLYSSLNQMDKDKLNVSTVEDPVEYHLNGITQVQTHEKIGMSFAAALRSLLRQDPDVVMLGEIRDSETARIAIQASLTGHLVLSTLHTNDAPSSITRLINIGVEPFLIGASLNATLAQRLVRKICDHCKVQRPVSDEIGENLALQGIMLDQLWYGEGCDRCRKTGYSGRLGMYEMLVLDDVLRDKIAANPNVTEFRRWCVERGMVTLRQDGFAKVAAGKTTVEEVMRVTEATI